MGGTLRLERMSLIVGSETSGFKSAGRRGRARRHNCRKYPGSPEPVGTTKVKRHSVHGGHLHARARCIAVGGFYFKGSPERGPHAAGQSFSPLTSSLILGFLWANWHLPLMLAHVYNVTWWQFVPVTMAASIFLSFGFNKSGGSTLCAVIVHGFYNVGAGIILNDFIGKATLFSNAIHHNVFWIAYAVVAALLCVVTNGQLGYRPPGDGS